MMILAAWIKIRYVVQKLTTMSEGINPLSLAIAIDIASEKVRISCPRSIEACIYSYYSKLRKPTTGERRDLSICTLHDPYCSRGEGLHACDLIRRHPPSNILSGYIATTPSCRSSDSVPVNRCTGPLELITATRNRSFLSKALRVMTPPSME
jgi:hypothetical protein